MGFQSYNTIGYPLEGCTEEICEPIVSAMVMRTSTAAEFFMSQMVGMVTGGLGAVLTHAFDDGIRGVGEVR